jgi:phosphate transport system permease protein
MILSKNSFLFRWNADEGVGALLAGLAGLCVCLLLLIVLFLAHGAWPVLREAGWLAFLSPSSGWRPLEGQFGLTPMIWASLAMMAGATAIAAPLGVAGAIFVRFFAPPSLGAAYKMMVGLLAGIPSVVYGLWGLTVMAPLIGAWRPPGASLLAAILILALMIAPTIAATSLAALSSLPPKILMAAAALGMRRRGQIIGVALPSAASGIAGGILLAMARALGETMAVLMVAGNVVQNPHSLFAPVRALTANIALEMAYAMHAHRAALFASGLFLMAVVFIFCAVSLRLSKVRHG